MLGKLVPFGYSVPGAAAHLETLMCDEQTYLVDIRSAPGSRRLPQWNKSVLQAKYGRRYLWLGETLGNVNDHHDRPIVLANPGAGIPRLINGLSKGYTLVLLCTCKQYETCHRRAVVEEVLKGLPTVQVIQPTIVQTRTTVIKCLSIRPPYASWLANPQAFIAAGVPPKTIENRDWRRAPGYRGPLLLHSSSQFERDAIPSWLRKFPRLDKAVSLAPSDYPRSMIVGIADLVDVIDHSTDPWFVGELGFVLANARPLEPVSCKGALGLFDVEWPISDVEVP